jgi:glycosyltransferase involved in cell wall biosynthesis
MLLAINATAANREEKTGVEWYSYFLLQEFKKLIPSDVEVVLYLSRGPQSDLLPLPYNWRIKILKWPLNKLWSVFRLSLEMLVHKPDVLFVPSHTVPFFAPKNTFTTIHDIGFERFPETYGRLSLFLQKFGVWRAKKAAKMIFTPSEFTKKELVGVCAMSPEKISVTPLGCATESSAATENFAEGIFKKYGTKKPYFIFVGRREKKKNITGIIEAFKIFKQNNPDYSLVLVGSDGRGWRSSAKYSKLDIVTIGWLPKQQITALMKNAEALLFPSLYEGFGLPILEAFACETPVITSNCASMPETAGDAALFVDPLDPRQIAQAMERIVKDYLLRTKIVQKGKARLMEFGWEKCAKATLNFLLN